MIGDEGLPRADEHSPPLAPEDDYAVHKFSIPNALPVVKRPDGLSIRAERN